jgi:hypothetical protein
VHSQLSQWKSLADDREARLAQQAAAVHQLEGELRQQHTKHEAALAELQLMHQQVCVLIGWLLVVQCSALHICNPMTCCALSTLLCRCGVAAADVIASAATFWLQEEALQAAAEAKERELESAQEGMAVAQRVAADRDRELAGRMDASADQVCEQVAPMCMCAHRETCCACCGCVRLWRLTLPEPPALPCSPAASIFALSCLHPIRHLHAC